jgi:hypothetical protein
MSWTPTARHGFLTVKRAESENRLFPNGCAIKSAAGLVTPNADPAALDIVWTRRATPPPLHQQRTAVRRVA